MVVRGVILPPGASWHHCCGSRQGGGSATRSTGSSGSVAGSSADRPPAAHASRACSAGTDDDASGAAAAAAAAVALHPATPAKHHQWAWRPSAWCWSWSWWGLNRCFWCTCCFGWLWYPIWTLPTSNRLHCHCHYQGHRFFHLQRACQYHLRCCSIQTKYKQHTYNKHTEKILTCGVARWGPSGNKLPSEQSHPHQHHHHRDGQREVTMVTSPRQYAPAAGVPTASLLCACSHPPPHPPHPSPPNLPSLLQLLLLPSNPQQTPRCCAAT